MVYFLTLILYYFFTTVMIDKDNQKYIEDNNYVFDDSKSTTGPDKPSRCILSKFYVCYEAIDSKSLVCNVGQKYRYRKNLLVIFLFR